MENEEFEDVEPPLIDEDVEFTIEGQDEPAVDYENALMKEISFLVAKNKELEAKVDTIDQNLKLFLAQVSKSIDILQEQNRRLSSEVEEDKDKLNGEFFNPLLKGLCRIYSQYLELFSKEIESRDNNIYEMFDDILRLLDEYDVEIISSKLGDEWKYAYAQEFPVPTDDVSLDRRIACSKNPGFKKKNTGTILRKENIGLYIYQEQKK